MNLIHGDCLEVLKTLPDCSVDSVVTDPPAGISFMGKDWDHHKGGRDEWIAWLASILKECNRVLKPGGHALVWSIPRTSHWTGMACEHAGFEVRDQISHLFGSGFPKSLNVSKAIDKEAGAEPIVIGKSDNWRPAKTKGGAGFDKAVGEGSVEINVTAPATDAVKQWDGWGTALKPSREDWWLCRKPISESTVAKNVVKHGTGALNIDGSRISVTPEDAEKTNRLNHKGKFDWNHDENTAFKMGQGADITQGRWPSHTIFDEDAAAVLDEQVGHLGGPGNKKAADSFDNSKSVFKAGGDKAPSVIHDRGGSASRFFYVAKASKSERNKGCEDLDDKSFGRSCAAQAEIKGTSNREKINNSGYDKIQQVKNHHPTVKSIKLMEYLIKLVTPPNGTVLDPFMGSGSTGVAAKNLGHKFIGIEQNEEYFEISKKRIS